MNVSKAEQRTLHALAQGGLIKHYKNERGRIISIECLNRDGWLLADCTLGVFQRLRRRDLIASHNGGAYRITRNGLEAVRAQVDNR
jgi:uncharacterized protein YjhX (UPF0386 family)